MQCQDQTEKSNFLDFIQSNNIEQNKIGHIKTALFLFIYPEGINVRPSAQTSAKKYIYFYIPKQNKYLESIYVRIKQFVSL